VNHNGDPGTAIRLVDAAKQAAANAVKFQTFITSKVVVPTAPMAAYQRENVGADKSQYDLLRELELPFAEFGRLKRHADTRDILFLSTADDVESVDFLDSIGVPAFKIGSGEVDNLPLLEHVARKRKPIILSTGMATLGEVEVAVRAIEDTGNHEIVLLHCVSNYPARAADCNLRAMDTLARSFGYGVGFSDHTEGIEVGLAAIALGACVLEKHFTLDKRMPGPDHRVSLAPAEFAELTRTARSVEQALGTGTKRPAPAELETRKVVRRCIVTTRAIHEGEEIRAADLRLMRCVGGLPPALLPLIIGRRARCDMDAMAPVTFDALA
jgi:N-acetylneuraminate synthase/N,N'-diacetyllegionaminate synthase